MTVASVPEDLGLAAEPDPRVRYRKVLIARLVVVAAILGVWQATVEIGLVDAFWISSPVLVVQELWSELASGAWFGDVAITVLEAVIAFVISSVLGIVAGLLLARSPFWDDVLAPLVLALNSLPRVALAPLIILWFGIGMTAKVVTAFTLVFFILL
jgi:ABC-type nitrate/sulfonate/bicarbonate transport system, permease component